jgi:hypothetical protein
MKAKDTKIHPNGFFRCCVETIDRFCRENPEKEIPECFVMDCEYEEKGNKSIIFKDNIWQKQNNLWFQGVNYEI